MIKIIHPMAGALAFLTIVTFWLSMPFSELFASDATVTAVKTGFLLLIPALAAAGGSKPEFGICSMQCRPSNSLRVRRTSRYSASTCETASR